MKKGVFQTNSLKALSGLIIMALLMTGCTNPSVVEDTPPENDIKTTPTEDSTDSVVDTESNDPDEIVNDETTVLLHEYPINEYERGIWYGFAPDGISIEDANNETVSLTDYCDMLGKMIEAYDQSKVEEWNELTKDVEGITVKRDCAALVLLYAAETIDLNTINTLSGRELSDNAPIVTSGNFSSLNPGAPLKKNVDPYRDEGYKNKPRLPVSYDYAVQRISCITHKPLLEGEWRPEDDLTLYEAVVSVVRLYESSEEKAYETAKVLLDMILETGEADPILVKAEERKKAILESTTTIEKSDVFVQGSTYTGTAYYVSQDGDDSNDGLSEETPFKTFEALSKVRLKSGDAVFFKRGETWYDQVLSTFLNTEGITISSYGEGEKPKFYSSYENSSGSDKWEIFCETEDGGKIWKYYRNLPDASVIVMNGGETFAQRACPFWTGNGYYEIEDDGLSSEPYDFKSELHDMEFFQYIEYPAVAYLAERIYESGYSNGRTEYVEGEIYLRCDSGNPGDLYYEIQIPSPSCLITGLPSYTTIDNINMSYSGSGMSGGHQKGGNESLRIQNCESGWMGGAVYAYQYDPSHAVWRMGGTLNVGCAGCVIINNYVHHAYQEGPTLETFVGDDGFIENVEFCGNLLEYCTMGSLITNWDQELKESHIFRNFKYADNMVLFSGFESYYNNLKTDILPNGTRGQHIEGWLNADSRCFGLITAPNGPNAHDGTLSVEDNVFAFSYGKIIEISFFTDEYSKVFDGNTYAQIPGFAWLSAYRDGESFERPRETDPITAMEKIGDENAVIIRFDE